MIKVRCAPPLFLFIFTLASCCKEYCASSVMDLYFTGVQSNGSDTLIIREFRKGSDFTEKLDTLIHTQYAPPGDTIRVYLTDLDLGNDFEMKLARNNNIFRLSDISSVSRDCLCSSRRIRHVNFCRVNGEAQRGDAIYLRQ